MITLHHWHHVYADGDWEPGLREHLTALRSSGLYEALSTFNVGIVGDWSNRDDVIDYIQHGFKMDFRVCAEADTGWEQVTLNDMLTKCKPWFNNGLVLYTHSKGAAFPGEHPDRWRRAMTHYVVYGWKDIVEKMGRYPFRWDTAGAYFIEEGIYEEGVPAFAGVHGVSSVVDLLKQSSDGDFEYSGEIDEPQPIIKRVHYSGNFWWATSEWINQLPNPCPENTRWDGEMLIGRSEGGRFPRALNLAEGSPFEVLKQA